MICGGSSVLVATEKVSAEDFTLALLVGDAGVLEIGDLYIKSLDLPLKVGPTEDLYAAEGQVVHIRLLDPDSATSGSVSSAGKCFPRSIC